MKNTLKGKMVKTNRPKIDVSNVECECISCQWSGDVIETKSNDRGALLCPLCSEKVVIYEI